MPEFGKTLQLHNAHIWVELANSAAEKGGRHVGQSHFIGGKLQERHQFDGGYPVYVSGTLYTYASDATTMSVGMTFFLSRYREVGPEWLAKDWTEATKRVMIGGKISGQESPAIGDRGKN